VNRNSDATNGLAERLLEWWESGGRGTKYPWRTDRDLYRSVVTEVLLTRTRRETVNRIYRSFFSRFPDPETLTEADESEIAEFVFPLGLRKRVEMLKRLARELSVRTPKRPEDLTSLPGVGKYSSEILSLKLFGTGNVPADRNVGRVVFRVISGRDPPVEKPENEELVSEFLYELGRRLTPEIRLKLAYALVDLGHEICRPCNPRCSECPIGTLCAYRRKGTE